MKDADERPLASHVPRNDAQCFNEDDAELSAHEKIVAAATTFVQAHKEDYELLRTSNSMDVDVEFMELCDAVLEFKPDAP